jgi:predicted kinase
MVGYPASGKTTIANKLQEFNYIRIDGDSLKTSSKMIKEAEKHIVNSSVIFDCTNSSIKKRSEFGKKHKIYIKVILLNIDIDTALDYNKERAKNGGTNIAFYVFRKNYVKPTLAEGIDFIIEL